MALALLRRVFTIPIVVLLCLTGLVMLYKPQLYGLQYGHLQTVAPGGQPASYARQVEAASARYPGTTVVAVHTPPAGDSLGAGQPQVEQGSRTLGERLPDGASPWALGNLPVPPSTPVGSGTVGSGTVGSGTVGSGTVGSGTVGSGTVGSGTVEHGTAGHGAAGGSGPGGLSWDPAQGAPLDVVVAAGQRLGIPDGFSVTYLDGPTGRTRSTTGRTARSSRCAASRTPGWPTSTATPPSPSRSTGSPTTAGRRRPPATASRCTRAGSGACSTRCW